MILLMHCPVDSQVETETSVLNPFLRHYNIDSSRVYLTGMSMGGLGSWMFAARYPGKQNDWHGCIIIHTIPYSEWELNILVAHIISIRICVTVTITLPALCVSLSMAIYVCAYRSICSSGTYMWWWLCIICPSFEGEAHVRNAVSSTLIFMYIVFLFTLN